MKLGRLLNETLHGHNAGGWVTPSGDYTETHRHIEDIIQHPAQFGLTAETIEDVYKRHGEVPPSEGEAREEIIKLVLQRGWVRFRRYKNYWSLTLHRLDSATLKQLQSWVRTMQKTGVMSRYDDLKILEVSTDDLIELDTADLLAKRSRIHEGITEMNRVSKRTTVADQPAVELLPEVKLSRVYSHFTGKRPVAIITAFRGERTIEENTRMNRELASELRQTGLGFVWVDGAWIENRGDADERHASEVSILAIGEEGADDKIFDVLVTAAKRYNQDGFIFKATGKAPLTLFDKNGTEQLAFNRVSMDAISDMYTRLRSGGHGGRSFVFESEREPVGFMGKLLNLKD